MRCIGQAALLAASTLVLCAPVFAQEAALPPLDWKKGAVNAAITATAASDGSQVGGTSKLELDTAGLKAAVTGTIITNTTRDTARDAPPMVQVVTDPGSWTKAQLGVRATADGPIGSTIELTGQQQISQSVSPYAPGSGTARQTLETQVRSGAVKTIVPLLSGLDAELGGAVAQSSTRNATVGGDTGTHLQTGDTEVSGALAYRLNDKVKFNGGVAVERQDVDLNHDQSKAASYGFVKPKAGVTVSPWPGATADVGVEHAVEPLSGANYMALSSVSERPQDLRITPDRAWQYKASVKQTVGAASIGASLVEGRSGTATELAPIASGQTPASVAMNKKQKATVAISLPLEGFGLADTKLQSQATWRQSQVRDPVTGQLRSANGEVPREASVNLTKDLPGTGTKIGVSGQLGTTRQLYQVNQTTQMRASPRVGAFVSYAPGPLSLDVRVDGLMGGTQQFTDTLYNGSRNGPVSGTSTRKAGDTHISFSFSRKM